MTPYRVLITGSRDWRKPRLIASTLRAAEQDANGRPIVVVHGACPTGADHHADQYARLREWAVEPHPADWSTGRFAGPVRNMQMVQAGADLCLAFIRDHSVGATGCADLAEHAGIATSTFLDCPCHHPFGGDET